MGDGGYSSYTCRLMSSGEAGVSMPVLIIETDGRSDIN
jgi:hypothetical protein